MRVRVVPVGVFVDDCEVRLCDPRARVRPCPHCVSRLPRVSFYRFTNTRGSRKIWGLAWSGGQNPTCAEQTFFPAVAKKTRRVICACRQRHHLNSCQGNRPPRLRIFCASSRSPSHTIPRVAKLCPTGMPSLTASRVTGEGPFHTWSV